MHEPFFTNNVVSSVRAIARAQGAVGFGPITQHEQMAQAFADAIKAVEGGAVAVVDVRVKVGYAAATQSAMTGVKA